MSELRQGQLVMVWNNGCGNRHIRIFVERGTSSFDGSAVCMCRNVGEDEKYAIAWRHCAPLEQVEPDIFLASEKAKGGKAMSDFRKGQIVVVNSPEEDDRQWHLRLYESQIAPDVHKTYNPEKENYDTWSWCRPAEDVWPFIFLGREHSKTGNGGEV